MKLLSIADPNTHAIPVFEDVSFRDGGPIKKAKRINDFFDSLSDSCS